MTKALGSKKAVLTASSLFLLSFISVLLLILTWFLPQAILVQFDLVTLGALSLDFSMMISWSGLVASSVIYLIAGCVVIFSIGYMEGDKKLEQFFFLVSAFVFSMSCLIYFPNLLFLMIGWDGLGVISFLLVIYYSSKEALAAGFVTAMTNRLGDVFLFLAISYTVCYSCLSWMEGGIEVFLMSFDGCLMSLFIVMGAMTKSAQFPFMSWLPAAMIAPTPISALVHSSTLVTAGVFLLYRFGPVILSVEEVRVFLFSVSLITMVLSGGICCVEQDVKKIVAYSTLSQLGVMMYSMSIGMFSFGFFHLLMHAIFKSLMFLCVGFIIFFSSHSQDFRSTSPLWWKFPFVSGSFLISVLCTGGAPFLSGYYSKELIVESILSSSVSLFGMSLFLMGLGFTTVYSFRLCLSVLKCAGLKSEGSSKLKSWYLFPMMMLELSALVMGAVFSSSMSPFFSALWFSSKMKMILLSFLLLTCVLFVMMGHMMSKLDKSIYFFVSMMFMTEYIGQTAHKSSFLVLMKPGSMIVDQGLFNWVLSDMVSPISDWILNVKNHSSFLMKMKLALLSFGIMIKMMEMLKN